MAKRKVVVPGVSQIAPPKGLSAPLSPQRPLSKPVAAGGSPKTLEQHMASRKSAGLTHRQVASEFNTSKSTVGRKVGSNNMLKQGFNRLGSAD